MHIRFFKGFCDGRHALVSGILFAGAHGRFVPKAKNKREARIQTLEPEPWMFEVEKYGHATRRAVPQSQLDV